MSPTKTSPSLYARDPLDVIDGIPVFSGRDAYSANYETIAEDHLRQLAATGQHMIDEPIWEQIESSTRALLRQHVPAGARVLDVGVGLGRLLGPMREYARHGMDISLKYLAEARKSGIDVCCARIEDMPFLPGSFDAVVCTDVLEHVLDLNLCCRQILGAVKPGGLMFARVPYREDLAPYLAPDYPYRLAHLRSFDDASVVMLFERILGCRIVETATAGYGIDGRRLRLRIDHALWRKGWNGIAVASRLLGAAAHQAVVRALYNPIDINVVVRKPVE